MIRRVGSAKMTLRALRIRKIDRSATQQLVRAVADCGRAARTSSRLIWRRLVCPWPAQACRAGIAWRRLFWTFLRARGRMRGGVWLPRRTRSNQVLSSLSMGAGRPLVCRSNQAGRLDTRSSWSMPAAFRTAEVW